MTDLTHPTLAAARDGLKGKDFSSTVLTGAYLKAIEAANPKLNAFVAVTGEQALAQAKASDAKLAAGQGGALEGVPLSGSRTYSPPRVCTPRRRATSSMRSSPNTNRA